MTATKSRPPIWAERTAKLMKKYGFNSNASLALSTGLAEETVRLFLQGRGPTLVTLEAISKALHTTASKLIEEKN